MPLLTPCVAEVKQKVPPLKGTGQVSRGTTLVPRCHRGAFIGARTRACQDNGRLARPGLLVAPPSRPSSVEGEGEDTRSAGGSGGMFGGLAGVRLHRTGLAGPGRATYSSPSQPVQESVPLGIWLVKGRASGFCTLGVDATAPLRLRSGQALRGAA